MAGISQKIIVTTANLGKGLLVNSITKLVDVFISTDSGNTLKFGSDNGLYNQTTLPILAADPSSPTNGQVWVKQTIVAPAGTLQGFFGTFPICISADIDTYALSVETPSGIVRTTLS